jgi:hypothetical protein
MWSVKIVLLFYLCAVAVWAQDEVSPYGNFLITSVGRTEKTGRIRILNDMPDVGKYVLITPDSVTFDGVTLRIRNIVHEQFTESEYMLWTGGSAQGSSTFNDIGFQGTVLHYFRFQYDTFPGEYNWVDNLFIQCIEVLSDRRYLISGNYYEYFCEKID